MIKSKDTLQGTVINLLYISPFIFPLYLFRFSVYGIPFTVLEVFTYLLFGIWLLGVITGGMRINWDKPLRYYWIFAFILLVGATIGVITAPHYLALPDGEILDTQRIALGVWKGWLLAPMLYFAVLTQTIKTDYIVKKLMHLFVYSGAVVALAAYYLSLFGNGITYDLRLSGLFESANYLSLYLVPPLLLSIYFMLRREKPNTWEHYLDLSSLTIMAHALFFTKSYAAVIGIFGAIVLFILYLGLKKVISLRNIIIGFFVLIATFVVIVFTQIDTPKFRQFVDFENRSSSTVRLEIYEITWGLIDEYPLTGVGPGLFQANYQTKGPDILGRAPMEWNIPHPHNIFFAFWLNAGLLGLLALFAFLILAHIRFTYPIIALWGIIIHGLFDTPFWKNDLAMIFWLILGAIVILQTYGVNSSKIKKGPIRKRLAPRVSKRLR